jgi:hypothetical protein
MGVVAQRLYFNYEMGIGHSKPVPHLPDAVTNDFTEEGARAFYRRWADFMKSESWDDMNAVKGVSK